ncbi:hypothetical protein MLD38_035673 [Melastoma candidum]|uniref:Uncharacterized protein n=1 Tax=Melastoma candidum TaxID=119954 RepID=A0ACB9LHC7_9MYRT|nr:hypothetical protein MLD38_035673 [Melastoma candidum]
MAKALGGLTGVRELEEMLLRGRMYKDEAERARHFGIFKSNVEFIQSFNRDGDTSYSLGISKFGDMTVEIFSIGSPI